MKTQNLISWNDAIEICEFFTHNLITLTHLYIHKSREVTKNKILSLMLLSFESFGSISILTMLVRDIVDAILYNAFRTQNYIFKGSAKKMYIRLKQRVSA
jgi:hypothetical protein